MSIRVKTEGLKVGGVLRSSVTSLLRIEYPAGNGSGVNVCVCVF